MVARGQYTTRSIRKPLAIVDAANAPEALVASIRKALRV